MKLFTALFLMFYGLFILIIQALTLPFPEIPYQLKRLWTRVYRIHIEKLPLGIVFALEVIDDLEHEAGKK